MTPVDRIMLSRDVSTKTPVPRVLTNDAATEAK